MSNTNTTTQKELHAWLVKADDLHLKGRLDEAEALYRKILAADPRHAQALHLLGVLSHQRGNPMAAVDLIGRAISVSAQTPDFYVNRGVALLAVGMPDAAIEHFRAALKLRPDLPQAYLNLGVAQGKQGKLSEAADSYRQAIKLAPGLAQAHFNLGAVLESQGNRDAAADSFRQATQLQPGRCDAYYLLTRSRGMSKDGAQVAREIHDVLERRNIDEKNASFCHFALGKIYDDIGDYAKAFEHYQRANALEHKRVSFDRAEHSARVDWIIQTFGAEFFASRRELGSTSARPILIVGMPRSGTTLIEQIVSCHSRVYGAGELEFWDLEAAGLGRAGVAALTREQVNALAERYLSYLGNLAGSAEIVTDKMPHNFLHLGLVHLAFPHAKIVNCLRNPADICLSIYFHKFTATHAYANDLENLAFYYREYHRLMEHWRRVLPPEILQEVRYESLVTDQETVSRALIESLGLEWEDRCLDFHRSQRVVRTPSEWQVRQPIYRHSVARWKNYLPYIAPLLPLAAEYDRDVLMPLPN